jgi:dihydrolipoamide dehydrogenase
MYDAVIIGGGPGGYVAAIRLSQLGKRVALIEKEYLGGTCTNKGCIPTKAMLTASHLYHEARSKSSKFGLGIENMSYDIKGISKHMNKSITLSRKGIEYLMKKNKVDLFTGTGKVESSNKVRIEETGEILECRNLILAQGSKPSIFPPFDKVEGIWTSDDIFKMEKIPESIIIIGGGVIGVEFATFFASLQKEVIIIELMNHILPSEDEDTASVIKKSLQSMGVKIYEKTKVTKAEKGSEDFTVFAEDKDGNELKLSSEKILFSVGRRPNITKDIEDLGVKIEKGIVTDLKMRANIENVYAIGDIRGKIMLAHVAMHEGIVAAHNIVGEEMEMDYSAVPSIIFSNPEIASVGLKEWQIDKNKVKVSKFPLSANGRAATMAERNGFVKVIADKESDRILGVTVVSPSATDMIMEGVLAVKYSMTAKQLYESIHPHPTLSESLLGAFEGIDNLAIHI